MKYSGRLSEPVVKARLGPLADDSAVQNESTRIAGELVKKMPLLFEAHGIEEGNYAALAMALATAHVPGFKIIQPAGRPEEWTAADKAALRVDIDLLKAEKAAEGRAITVRDAIKLVMQSETWKPRAAKAEGKDGKLKISSIEQHYYAARQQTKAAIGWLEMATKAKAFDDGKDK